MVSFPVCYISVGVNFRHLVDPASVGRDHGSELYLSIFQQGRQCDGLENRTRFSRTTDSHVEVLSELSLAVSLEVYHSPYGSGLHIQHHNASAFDLLIVSDVSSQSPVGDVLDVYVQGGPDVHAMLHIRYRAVRVRYASLVRPLHPLRSLLSMEDIVVLALYSEETAFLRILLVYPDVSDHSSGKRTVRILPGVDLCLDHSALELTLFKKGKLAELKVGAVVNILGYRHIPSAFERFRFTVSYDQTVVVVCCLSVLGEHLGQFVAQFACLCPPCPLERICLLCGLSRPELILQDCAVHVYVVQGSRNGQKLSVHVHDGSSFRLCLVFIPSRLEI